jgi:pimeloyl-ACP methyl ester carboxylesterase
MSYRRALVVLPLISLGFLSVSAADDGKPVTTASAAAVEQPVQIRGPKPSIILVHGAFADALGWDKVMRVLFADGYRVTAVENTLTSLAADVATTKRVIDAESASGQVVVVGHSYGGAVITGAAFGETNVKALVYVDAFAPEVGETLNELTALNPSQLGGALIPDSAGFLTIARDQFRSIFAADVPPEDARVVAAAQKPIAAAAFGEVLPAAAWKTIPSYCVIGLEDQAIPPATLRFMAARIHASVLEIHGSHVVFVSHPQAVARFIEKAAAAR